MTDKEKEELINKELNERIQEQIEYAIKKSYIILKMNLNMIDNNTKKILNG